MSRKHGPWAIHQSSLKYANPFIRVTEDTVTQPDGQPGTYGTVAMNPGVCLLPLDREGHVILTRQFRYALGRVSVELAAGSVDEGESPRDAAVREAREELGVEADEWQDLGCYNLDTSVIRCPVHFFVARGLRRTKPAHEGTEAIQILRLPFDEVLRRVMDAEITHTPSCVLMLKAARLIMVNNAPECVGTTAGQHNESAM